MLEPHNHEYETTQHFRGRIGSLIICFYYLLCFRLIMLFINQNRIFIAALNDNVKLHRSGGLPDNLHITKSLGFC